MTAAAPPLALPVLVERIPAELTAVERWVVWRWTWTKDGWTKPPFDARTGERARVTDPDTWSKFDAAVAAYRRGGWDGLGVVLVADGGLTGVDLDHCVAGDSIDPDAERDVAALDSYTERSPSGTGIRVVLRARKPPGRCKVGTFEVYDRGRYLTITGHVLDGRDTIEGRQEQLDAWHARRFPAPSRSTGPPSGANGSRSMTDGEVLELARNARNGTKFAALYGGSDELYDGDTSVGDLALCSMLAFWTQDGEQIDRLFRGSRRMRSKWDERRGDTTYAAMTVAKALADTTEHYTPPPPTTVIGDPPGAPSPNGQAAAAPHTLAEAHAVFRRWLGDDYDLDALDAALAAGAGERLSGDPLWLLLISGSGNAKTETVQSLVGAGAHVASTITGEGALLSGSPKKQRTRDATGGLLNQLGERGLLVIKDVTSILSMHHDARGLVLSALREVHDGLWVRKLGVDGGRELRWSGRIVVVGAVTTAWDRAHDVIAKMGDRFLLLRMDSSKGRITAGRRSRHNVGHEVEMRAELAAAAAGVLADVDPAAAIELTDEEGDRLLAAADLVTRARTGVDYDYRGDVIDAHAPEMPTRFTKQLVQLVRGAVAIGMDRADAMRLAVRCARDSMPPLRLAAIEDLAKNPASTPTEVRRRLDKPRATVDRQLQALYILGVLRLDELVTLAAESESRTTWRYSLAENVDPAALKRYQISHPTDTGAQGREA